MATPAPIPGAGPQRPSLSLRVKAAMIMGATGILSKAFLYGLNRVEVNGLSRFLDILDSRKDPAKRERGLLTVSNHVSVLDDPVVWGILPFRYLFDPSNLRWTLGAADICFANKLFSNFFTHGQVLPCHRLKHSPYGGPFQPAITQALGLLSKPSFVSSTNLPSSPPPSDSSGQLQHHPAYYTTTGRDLHPSPLSYPLHRRYSWVHVFPEGCVHQHSGCDLRYFKWGLARLILESDPVPDVLPMFIDGTQRAMPEDRGFPRFLPRIGQTVRVTFGEVLDYEATFGDLKRRWDGLVVREMEKARLESKGRGGRSWKEVFTFTGKTPKPPSLLPSPPPTHPSDTTYHDTTLPEPLRNSPEAQEIRIQVALRMRDEILKLRRSLGRYPEPEPSFGLAETWREDEGIEAKKYKSRVDGSDINQD